MVEQEDVGRVITGVAPAAVVDVSTSRGLAFGVAPAAVLDVSPVLEQEREDVGGTAALEGEAFAGTIAGCSFY